MIARGIKIGKRRGVVVELIAQHEYKVPTARHAFSDTLLRRHFSLQYFTSVQFFAHALRHVINFPQRMHSLLGSVDLLPLNPVFKVIPVHAG